MPSFCLVCNTPPASGPSNIENPRGINAVLSSSMKASWKLRISSMLRVTSSISLSENIYRVAFLSLDVPWLSEGCSGRFCEARGSCEKEGVREFEDNADVKIVEDVGERMNGDIDILEDELATGRQLKTGSWRI